MVFRSLEMTSKKGGRHSSNCMISSFPSEGGTSLWGEEDFDYYYEEKEVKTMMAMALIRTFMKKIFPIVNQVLSQMLIMIKTTGSGCD